MKNHLSLRCEIKHFTINNKQLIITIKKYTTMIAIAFITLAISAAVALRIRVMIMENHRHAM